VTPRGRSDRRADTLAKLNTPEIDVWVATGAVGADGALPYLVPVSLAWIDERVVIAVASTSATARNIIEHRRARLGLGPTRDVVMIDVVLERAVDVHAAPEIAERYADQADWDPRGAGRGEYVFLVLRPDRIQAWREANELQGRLLMRDGVWLD
jgi:hypothetical protein